MTVIIFAALAIFTTINMKQEDNNRALLVIECLNHLA